MAANGVEDKKTQEVKNKVDTGAVDEVGLCQNMWN